MPHEFTSQQILHLLSEAKKESERDWLMILVAFIHALRATEVVGGWNRRKNKQTGKIEKIYWPGIHAANIVGSKLVLSRLKNSNPVEDDLFESENPLLNERAALIALCRKTPPNQRLFPITSRTFQRKMHAYGKLAGLPELFCHPHTLKHSILEQLRLSGMDLAEIQDRGGHKNMNSLRVYLNPKKSVVAAKVTKHLASIGV